MIEAGDVPVLAVNELSISFTAGALDAEQSPAVCGVDFEIRQGQILALVGESGSGKSVTALAVLGLLSNAARISGSIRVYGQEMVGAPTETLRRVRKAQVGIVFQEPMSAFNPVLTVGEQLAEAIRVGKNHRGRGAGRDHAFRLLADVGLPEPERMLGAYPHQLSGGQLQRAMIAMATAREPDLLIADEPTTALDVTVQAGILDLIRSLRDDRDMAVLLITHDMGVVADLADDVLVMRDGSAVEAAPSERLFAAPQEEYTRTLLASVPRLEAAAQVRKRPEQQAPEQPVQSNSSSAERRYVAELEAASIAYRSTRMFRKPTSVVSDITIRIGRGEVCGLVGESGSGKSTVGRALVGLLPVSSGKARIEGQDLATVSRSHLRQLRSRVGYVFQDPASSLNPRATVAENIAEPLRVHTRLDAGGRRERVRELVEAVRLPRSIMERFGHELSGGQRQRVAIARALTLNPSLLIADEPTSALDVSVQASVLDLLRALQHELGFSCLFISHDLAVVRGLADRVAVMQAGELREEGPVSEVFDHPSSDYTRRLLAAVLSPDPVAQRERRHVWRTTFSTRALQLPREAQVAARAKASS